MKNDYLKYLNLCLQLNMDKFYIPLGEGSVPCYVEHPLFNKLIIALGKARWERQKQENPPYLSTSPWGKLHNLRYACFTHFKDTIRDNRLRYLKGEITEERYRTATLFFKTLPKVLRHYTYDQVFDLLEKEIELEELLNTEISFEDSVVQSIY